MRNNNKLLDENYFPGWLGAIPFVFVFLIWEVIGRLNIEGLQYIIPSPESVIIALCEDLAGEELWRHLWITIIEVFWGFLIAIVSALILGVAIGRSSLLDRIFYPIIVFLQAIPKVALAPLWLVIFGFGIGSKIALAAMVGFFPLLVGVMVGMSAMRFEELELMRSLKATSWQIFFKVQLPRAIPSIFGGIEVGIIFSLIGAVVGEFVGARGGLGYLIQFRSAQLDLPGIFSPIFILALIGLVIDLATKMVGKRLMKWNGE